MRRGFNRLEVGIILAVLAVLVGLTLPAVQKVREAASRMACANNLKQIGLACHNHASANGERFPPGTMPNPALPPEQRLSFFVALYPYVECSNVYSRVAKDEAWDSPTNAAAFEGRFRIFHCPSWTARSPDAPLDGHLGITNYVGVAGVGADAATRHSDAPGNGIFGYDRTIPFKDVKDGTENTAMLIETGRDVGPWVRGGPSTLRGVEVDDLKFGETHTRTSWTGHKRGGGYNITLADGSVRFAKPNIDPAVLAALATVAGREEIPADW